MRTYTSRVVQLACLSAIGSLDVPPKLGTSHAKTKIAIDSVECVNTHTPHTHAHHTLHTPLHKHWGPRGNRVQCHFASPLQPHCHSFWHQHPQLVYTAGRQREESAVDKDL